MFVSNQFKNMEERPNNNIFRESMIEVLEYVITNFIADKPMFSIDNFSLVYYDEYSMETNCHKDIISTLYLIIDQPGNYKPAKINAKTKANKITMPELYFSLDDIKKGILKGLLEYLDPNNLLWEDYNSLLIKSTDYNQEYGIINYYLKLIPCIAYHNDNNETGVMYYQNNSIQIEYPEQALANYYNKNLVTDDTFRQVILIFKNILLKDKKIERLPSEIIETVLYNVPTEMFIDESYDTLIRIINYLRNKSLKEIITLDEQDAALTSMYRSMSPFYVKHIIKLIEKFLLNVKH